MQKEGNLTSTDILLTTLKGYEKLMNAKEREKFYKMILTFSEAEKALNQLEEELNQQMELFEDSQEHVIKTFDFIMNKFKEFLTKYDDMSKDPIEMPPTNIKKTLGDIDGNKCIDECECKKKTDAFKGFKEFLATDEAAEFLEELKKHIME